MKLCCLGLHRWEKWGKPVDEDWERATTLMGVAFTSTGPIKYTVTVQRRNCFDCGLTQEREVRRA